MSEIYNVPLDRGMSPEEYEAYRAAPTEVRARQAGATAKQGFDKFMGMVPNVTGQTYQNLNYNRDAVLDFLSNWLYGGQK